VDPVLPGPRVLIAFHTQEGQTAKIAARISGVLTAAGVSVDTDAIDSAPEPAGYDLVVVGDSIHAVHHSKALRAYLRDHADALTAMPTALFQVSLTSANPDDAHTATAHGMVQELLDDTGFDPDIVAMFAGALVYTQYGWLKGRIMRAIVKREHGDTDMSRDYDYTDWDAVDAFGADLVALAHHAA
jgi:menaquinone-dependent protoporphyrinogen oxidase